jgi:hypothetical protein
MINSTGCCGLRQYSGLQSTPEATLRMFGHDLARNRGSWDGAFYLFTGNTSQCIVALCAYIKKYGLGEVVQTDPRRNPNSGNNVVCALVRFKKRKFHRWLEEQEKRQIQRNVFNDNPVWHWKNLLKEPLFVFCFVVIWVLIGVVIYKYNITI